MCAHDVNVLVCCIPQVGNKKKRQVQTFRNTTQVERETHTNTKAKYSMTRLTFLLLILYFCLSKIKIFMVWSQKIRIKRNVIDSLGRCGALRPGNLGLPDRNLLCIFFLYFLSFLSLYRK